MCIQNYVYSGKISCTGNFGKLISPADKTDATSLYLSAINISKVFLSTSCKLSFSLLYNNKKNSSLFLEKKNRYYL